MATLSSSIVKRGIASMKDVEEALARQVLYGGDLATNLLELAAVSEAELTGLLAESHALEPAPIGELPPTGSATLALLPGDVARRHGVYPLEERDGSLVVAVSEPLPREVEEDLGFALGVGILQRAAPQVRILQAIARDYGLAMDRRTLRLIAKLSGRPDPSPSSLPPRDGAHAPVRLPRPPSLPPLAYPSQTASEPEPELAGPVSLRSAAIARETQEHEPRPAPEFAAWANAAARPARRRARRRGPYTAATAEQDLLAAESRDDVLRASFDFIAQYFEYAALFAVHGDIAEGRDARGRGANRARITGVGVPLDLPGALATAREGAFQLVRLSDEGIDAALAKDLDRRPGRVVLLLPIVVRGRCVLIVYGDHGAADVDLSEVGDVIAFAPLVSAALERVIMRRKRGGRDGVSATPPPARARPQHAPRPSIDERAAALAQALAIPGPSPLPTATGPEREPPKQHRTLVSGQAPAPAASTPDKADARVQPNRTVNVGAAQQRTSPNNAAIARPVISVGDDHRVSTPPQGTPAAIESDRAADLTPVFPLTRRSTPSPARDDVEEPPEDGWDVASARPAFPAEESATRPGVGSLRPKPAPRAGEDATTGMPATRREGSNPKLELVPETALDEADGPDISVSESELDEDELADSDRKPTGTLRRGEVPLAPSSRSVAYGPRRLRPRHSSEELKLPSVIVDVEADCRDLVARLVKGEEQAGDKLVDLGHAAISALVAQFPGPINAEPRQGDGPMRASDCGPVLRTLARLGPSAVPYLVVRTADSSPDVRSWATRLLGEMPSAESAKAIVRRLVDPDPDVHRSALAAGRLLVADPDSRTALRDGLCALAADTTQSDEVRHAAIEALADLREARAVPRLARLLEDANGDIVKSAHWALVVLARQDFSKELGAWLGWWETHASKHRIEWLIDALMHETPDIRRSAGDELKSLTKEYFGYYDDLPRKERVRAQERYREWWESKGKARFPRT